jgi:hypothetical protein
METEWCAPVKKMYYSKYREIYDLLPSITKKSSLKITLDESSLGAAYESIRSYLHAHGLSSKYHLFRDTKRCALIIQLKGE